MNKTNNKFAKTLITVAVGITLTACGGSDSNDIVEQVTDLIPDTNSAPIISSVSNETATVDSLYSYTLQASDSNGDTLTLTSSSLPSWLSFDATTAILSGTPTSSDEGDHPITLTVSDGTDSAIDQFTITVSPLAVSNSAAVITSSATTDAMVGTDYSYTLTATDADSDALTMSTTIPTALSWLSFDAATGVLSGTPTIADLGATEITLVVNDGTVDTMQTFNITVTDSDIAASNTVTDFENIIDSYAFNNFDGGVSTVILNPEPLGINDSAQVVQMQKFSGQVWGGSTYDLETPVNIAAGSNNFTMKVWSQRAVPVLLKLEGMTELSVDHTGSGWEELSYDFTLTDGTLSQVTIIFDLGVNGDADADAAMWTFYYDDITTPNSVTIVTPTDPVTPGSFVTVGTPFDFEASGLGADFTWAVFENDDDLPLEFIANPTPSNVNDSDMVAMFTAKQAGQPWAGTETANATPVFTMDATNSIVKVMVYKSAISDVGIKFSVGAAAQPELKVANTKINEWEELTFDFSGRIGLPETIGITSVIVFPDFNARNSDTVNYFDNITFGHYE